MDKRIDFISYKKLLIFGTEQVGKTSLARSFQANNFLDDTESSNKGNIFYLIIYYILYFLNSF